MDEANQSVKKSIPKNRLIKYSGLGVGGFILLGFIIYLLLSLTAGYEEVVMYQTKSEVDGLEIRQYPEILAVQIKLQGERDEALEAGVKRLKAYLEGNNDHRQIYQIYGPILQEADEGQNLWTVSMLLPNDLQQSGLAVPIDDSIQFENMRAQTYAVIGFRGSDSDSNFNDAEKQLEQVLRAQRLVSKNPPTYAYYDPSWVFSYFKSNEVWIFVPPDFTFKTTE